MSANGNGHRLLTAAEVADRLSVPTSWVYSASRSGDIPCVELGRYRRFREEAIDAWVRDREKANAGRIGVER
jgi:excisionase family DNA binding protein